MNREEMAKALYDAVFGARVIAAYAKSKLDLSSALGADNRKQAERESLLDTLAIACERVIIRTFVDALVLSDKDLQDLVVFFSSDLGQRYMKVRMEQTAVLEPIIQAANNRLQAMLAGQPLEEKTH